MSKNRRIFLIDKKGKERNMSKKHWIAVATALSVLFLGAFSSCHTHDYEVISLTPKTCVKNGEEILQCKICGQTKVKTLYAFRATHGTDWDEEWIEPTCHSSGYLRSVCKTCGQIFYEDYVPMTHDFVDGVCTICGGVEEGTEGLSFTYNKSGGYYVVSGYKGSEANIVIPVVYEGEPVTEIGASAFSGKKQIDSVVIPDTVYNIGNNAFAYSSVKEIVGGKYLETIGDGAFLECGDLENFFFSSTIFSIGDKAFKNCENLSSSVDGSGLSYLGEESFYGCSSLKEVAFGDGLSDIGARAFANCVSLENVILGEAVRSISYGAFFNCISLNEVVFDESLREIGYMAFAYCTAIEDITVPYYLRSISARAFYECSSLKSFEFENPSSWLIYRDVSYRNIGEKGTSMTLKDSLLNAGYLTGDYLDYYWGKKI